MIGDVYCNPMANIIATDNIVTDVIAAEITSMKMDIIKADTSIKELMVKIDEYKKCLDWQKKHRDRLSNDIDFYDLCKDMIIDEIERVIIFALEEDVDSLKAKLHKVLGANVKLMSPFHSYITWTVIGECFDKREYSDLKWEMEDYEEVDVVSINDVSNNVCETLDEFECYCKFFGDGKIHICDEMFIKKYLFEKYLSDYVSHIDESKIDYGPYDESANIRVVMKKRLVGVVLEEKFADIMESFQQESSQQESSR